MRGRLIDLSAGIADGRQRLTIALDGDARELFDALKDTDVSVEIKKYRRKRSLDANAYAWVLMDKLAAALGLTKIEVYQSFIREIGGVSETVCVQENAVDNLIQGWRHNGLGWIAETMPCRIKGCVNVILYYGSSTYDTKQMSALIDSIVADCKLAGVETATPDEIAKYKEEWKP